MAMKTVSGAGCGWWWWSGGGFAVRWWVLGGLLKLGGCCGARLGFGGRCGPLLLCKNLSSFLQEEIDLNNLWSQKILGGCCVPREGLVWEGVKYWTKLKPYNEWKKYVQEVPRKGMPLQPLASGWRPAVQHLYNTHMHMCAYIYILNPV